MYDLTYFQIFLWAWSLGFLSVWAILIFNIRTRETLMYGSCLDILLALTFSAIPVFNLIWAMFLLAMTIFAPNFGSVFDWLDSPRGRK